MNNIVKPIFVCLVFGGVCFAEAQPSDSTTAILSDAQVREVRKYRTDQRTSQEKRLDYLTRHFAEKKQKMSEKEQQQRQKLIEDGKTDLEEFDKRTDSSLWNEIQSDQRHRGYQWQETTQSENGGAAEGKWVQVLTSSQLQEVKDWGRKEVEVKKERMRLKQERKEAVESGDSEKRRLIDARTHAFQGRTSFPITAYPAEQWEFIVKEQDRRGLEWYEPPAEKGQRRQPGRWRAKEEKAENR